MHAPTHTSGPWYAGNTKYRGSQGLIASETTGATIAVTYNPQDADLVATAPELLDVAKRIYAIWNDPDRSPSELADSVDRDWIRSVIAKAEGGAK